MRDFVILLIHLFATIIKPMRPGGACSVAAESLLLKQQLLVLKRARVRAPNLRPIDRVIAAIVEMKRRNPRFGCRRIAQQIAYAFGIDIDKDLVRRILAYHYRPSPGAGGPSWLSFLGHTKDSLWSVELFRCESASLKSHWVMLVMDQATRRIIGFAVHVATPDGVAVCRMLNRAIGGGDHLPTYLSSDNDPLFRFHRWRANLRILDIAEIKTVPYVPLSHPFVERLIGTIRREYLDHLLFWSATDLENKLKAFQHYYNTQRVHHALNGQTPESTGCENQTGFANLHRYSWKSYCRGLFKLPVPA